MTLAPQSASWRTQVGPERTRVRSSTVKRARAWDALGIAIGEHTGGVTGRAGHSPIKPALVYGSSATSRRLPRAWIGSPRVRRAMGTWKTAMMQLRAALAVAGALMMATPAAADEWPSRPVRMVNTFAAGGTADVLTRLVADQLSATFKQQFFVETRAGAAGTIGVKSVADSPPDGYNFALTNITASGAGADQQSQARLRSASAISPTSAMSPARRSCCRSTPAAASRRCKDFIDQGRDQREAADLFVVRRRQLGTTGRRRTSPRRPASRSSTCPTRAPRRA